MGDSPFPGLTECSNSRLLQLFGRLHLRKHFVLQFLCVFETCTSLFPFLHDYQGRASKQPDPDLILDDIWAASLRYTCLSFKEELASEQEYLAIVEAGLADLTVTEARKVVELICRLWSLKHFLYCLQHLPHICRIKWVPEFPSSSGNDLSNDRHYVSNSNKICLFVGLNELRCRELPIVSFTMWSRSARKRVCGYLAECRSPDWRWSVLGGGGRLYYNPQPPCTPRFPMLRHNHMIGI